MAALTTLHADEIALSYRLGGTLRRAGAAGFSFLSATTIAAADTNQGLQDAVTNVSVHADSVSAKGRVNRSIEYGDATSELSDARILGLTDEAGLIALTWLQNNSLYQDLLYA
jgi:hypothetical protein